MITDSHRHHDPAGRLVLWHLRSSFSCGHILQLEETLPSSAPPYGPERHVHRLGVLPGETLDLTMTPPIPSELSIVRVPPRGKLRAPRKADQHGSMLIPFAARDAAGLYILRLESPAYDQQIEVLLFPAHVLKVFHIEAATPEVRHATLNTLASTFGAIIAVRLEANEDVKRCGTGGLPLSQIGLTGV